MLQTLLWQAIAIGEAKVGGLRRQSPTVGSRGPAQLGVTPFLAKLSASKNLLYFFRN